MFDVESSAYHHRSCSMKHLAAENVMVNDLSNRPVSICRSCRCQLGIQRLSCTFDVHFAAAFLHVWSLKSYFMNSFTPLQF